ncbi:MAG: hypothetical protein XU09_C0004G0051 [Thaumarchaeota archaeon CSP1-1]|nr:MAG: hypothetical protein XU09_C0004G0051 [Thaumarchaeota archaeon CSP1-1]
MEFLLENILNLIGFVVGLAIGVIAYIGYKNTGSATLFRLSIAFLSISVGFFVVWTGYMAEDFVLQKGQIERWVQTLGIGIQTVGYFFIAFSHSIKSFFPKSRYLRSIGIIPLFLVSAVHIEHIFRSISFILLVYGAIETILSYFEGKKKGTIFVAMGLSFLALGEFLGWYSFVFPESILYYVSISIKIAGLISLFIPVSKIPLTKIKFDPEI